MSATTAVPTYTCAHCGETYDLVNDETWSDEMAMAEAADNGFLDTGPTAVICDDCYQEFMGWLTPEKKEQIDAEWKALT